MFDSIYLFRSLFLSVVRRSSLLIRVQRGEISARNDSVYEMRHGAYTFFYRDSVSSSVCQMIKNVMHRQTSEFDINASDKFVPVM